MTYSPRGSRSPVTCHRPPQSSRAPRNASRCPTRQWRNNRRACTAPRVRHLRVGADADAARDAFAPEVAEPVLADKLAVGAQIGDRREAEEPPELVHERDTFGGRRAALLLKDHPQHGEGRALMADAEDE